MQQNNLIDEETVNILKTTNVAAPSYATIHEGNFEEKQIYPELTTTAFSTLDTFMTFSLFTQELKENSQIF